MVVAGRAQPERVRPLLLAGAALLGAGLLAAAARGGQPRPPPRPASPPRPLGAGLLTALGFPYFARFVPEGEAGRYSGLFFAGRAVAAAAALPLAGLGGGAERHLPRPCSGSARPRSWRSCRWCCAERAPRPARTRALAPAPGHASRP